MNIVVCVKQVPDTNEVKIDPVTNNLVRIGVPSIINPADENAIEEALKCREKCGGTVTIVSMGPLQAEEVLQHGLDMGADRAILLSDRLFAGSDTLATGYALSALIKSLNPDIVFCGFEAIDGCTGQVGPAIAENLGFPQITYVNEIIDINNKEINLSREINDAYELLNSRLPALICVRKGINTPRLPKPGTKKPEQKSAGDLGLDHTRIGINGSPTRVVKIDLSGRRASSFVVIDSKLSADERIMSMINGGMAHKKITLTKGTAFHLAELISKDEIFSRRMGN